jgi:23S rRNA (guanosine2251-2'-O)-methyltransferase
VTSAAGRGVAAGRMLVYGRNPVREALRGCRRVHGIVATKEARVADLVADVGERPPLEIVSRDELDLRCGTSAHQGVACEADPYPYASADDLLVPEHALVVALDQVQDPQNLGAICRSAECAGATGVVVPERRSADVTPAVCAASAGAVEHLPVARVRNLADFLFGARERGAWVYGAAAEAPTRYTAPDYSGRTVLVLGAEGAGLRPRVRSACDDLVALPLRGQVGSLNVSAVAAVLLYEARRAGVPPAPP